MTTYCTATLRDQRGSHAERRRRRPNQPSTASVNLPPPALPARRIWPWPRVPVERNRDGMIAPQLTLAGTINTRYNGVL